MLDPRRCNSARLGRRGESRATSYCSTLRRRLNLKCFVVWSCACLMTIAATNPPRTQSLPKSSSSPRNPHPVTVADAIAMTQLGDPGYFRGFPSRGLVAHFSPNDKKFVTILMEGDLTHNTNRYSILLWRTDESLLGSPPEILVTMSSPSREAIKNVKWLSDNETITFLGESLGETQQLYTFNLKTRELRKLTSHPTSLCSYSTTPEGERVAFTAEAPAESFFDGTRVNRGFVVTTELLLDLLLNRRFATAEPHAELFVQSGNNQFQRASIRGMIGCSFNDPILSSDGKHVVIPTFVTDEIPVSWSEYSDPLWHLQILRKLKRGQSSSLRRYELIDTLSGKGEILLDSPLDAWGSEAVWSPDGCSVILAGVHLPLNVSDPTERKERLSNIYAVEVKIPSGNMLEIAAGELKLLGWDSSGQRLTFETGRSNTSGEPMPKILFKRQGQSWLKATEKLPESSRPEIVLEQDMNTPPKIFAVDPSTNRKVMILDLNPQFVNLQFGKVEEVSWKSTDDRENKGGLYYPVDYTPGRKYPLVIQTHGFLADRFWMTGPYSTAFAAQPLAGKGFMVLQTTYEIDSVNTPEEAPREAASFEGAINYLSQKNLIDPDHVGIIGFSRSCFHVKYALTHSKYHFAAASVTDGIDGGYLQYIAYATALPLEFEKLNAGLPFGDGLQSWLSRSPGFKIDKVQSPLLILAENPNALLTEWEWFAGLSLLHKPVELVYMKDGDHLLQEPWQRMLSLQGNVDWFSFWLKGEEDSDPSKAEQYARWRELRNRR